MTTSSTNDIYYKIAVFTFVSYIFVEFFGLAIPFQPNIVSVNKIQSSSIANQLVYSIIFLASLISIFPNYKVVINIIKEEKILTIFLIWCLVSVIWSVDPMATFKRFFRILTLFTVLLSIFSYTDSTDQILKYIKPVLYLYVFLSVPLSIILPGAKDGSFHTWRGFADTKNDLGQISVMCILLSFFIFKNEKGFYNRIFSGFAVLFSVALLFGSESMTSISGFLFISIIAFIFVIDNLFKPLGLGRAASTMIIIFMVGLIVAIILLAPMYVQDIFSVAGKNLTFSGRTELWLAILNDVSKNPLFGTGFQAFWSLNNPEVIELYKVFIWLPNEAHNGYLDILSEVGIIGLGIFLTMLIRYFKSIRKLYSYHPWKWIIIAALIINLQESTLFISGKLVGDLLVLSYLILFVQLKNQKKISLKSDI